MPRHLAAPRITGLVYQRDLGAGGFADVYLYQSISPKRLVAVKVLRGTEMDEKLAKRFASEADVMAELEHPHIVRVYGAGITSDGRPYIEMAYYPSESLAAALKRGPFSVQDVLRIGVQLASAVEAAHRAGLLHRDIKPANVLTDKYGYPALTDFGIASRLNETDDEDAGLSVPWAAPEVMFGTSPADQRSDIYSLGATLWQLLVGRAPFQIPGGDNRAASIMMRTRDLAAPPTGRGDVPASLERLLGATLSKDPRFRPTSAADFARALNAVEDELRLRPTPFTVERGPDDTGLDADTDASLTHRPGTPPREDVRADREPGPTVRRVPAPVFGAQGGAQPAQEAGLDDDRTRAHPSARLIGGLVLVGLLVVASIAGTAWWVRHSSDAPSTASAQSAAAVQAVQQPDLAANLPPGPVTISCRRSGNSVSCSWSYANALDTDTYRVLLPDGSQQAVEAPSFSHDSAGQFCIQVKVVRADGRFPGDWSQKGCA